jgi:2-polyprenyl-6-methoxyphenol hydroxylase-like FAD-dependent oxidoreductase
MGTVGPGPAVGGGTSIAMVGAYVLAQELAQAGRNYQTGLRASQDRFQLQATPARALDSIHLTGSTVEKQPSRTPALDPGGVQHRNAGATLIPSCWGQVRLRQPPLRRRRARMTNRLARLPSVLNETLQARAPTP